MKPKFRFDLMPFIGAVHVKGEGKFFQSSSDDFSMATHSRAAVFAESGKLDTRANMRFLFSEEPFTVSGRTCPDTEWKAEMLS